jgi:Tol biopolymer transport system component
LALATDRKGILIRDLETGQVTQLSGTEGAIYPFWSPDGRMIGFFSNGKLRTVPAAGGPVQIICDAPDGRGGTWSSTGVIVFTPNIEEPLSKVAEGGGTPVQITSLGGKGFTHRNPMFLPDGKHFLFLSRKVSGTIGEIDAGSIDGGEPKLVIEKASNPGYAQGFLLYMRDGNLVAQHFDTGSRTVSGNPVPVSENVEYWRPKDLGNFNISPNGTLIYRVAQSTQSRFAWMKLPGREIQEFGDAIAGIIFDSSDLASISPDGHRIAFSKKELGAINPDLWVMDVERNTVARLTFNLSGEISSAFSPDGTRVAYSATTGATDVLKIKSLTSGTEQTLTPVGNSSYITSWAPDGKYLVLDNQDAKTLLDIYIQPLDGGKPEALLNQPYNEFGGVVSSNGKWMSYFSNESGRVELYITDFPGAHSKWQVSTDGAYWSHWSRDGKHMYFANGDKLFSVEVRDTGTLELGKAETVTTLEGVQPIDFASDGRLLVLKAVSGAQAEPFRVIFHFPETMGR